MLLVLLHGHNMASTGAIAAYRGYRNQALYALHRILKSQPQGVFYQPERYEDLTVFKDSGELLEIIQVKDFTDNLTLSDFSPEKPDSFFRRCLKLIKEHPHASVKIVSFGPIGPEMRNAWAGERNSRIAIENKLSSHGFSSFDVESLFQNIEILSAAENILRDDVFSFLNSSLAGGDPENAFDLLHYWLYRASEKRELITYDTLVAKINGVGRYLSERAAYYQEWFTSIVPLEDTPIGEDEREKLALEFYQGVSTQYKHILGRFDVVREDKLQLVETALQKKRVVIIHGASGQGKSTLAYRYLRESVPEKWRYEIRLIEDRQHALRIARALSGHANAVNAPMVIYVDVSSRNKGWPDIIKELSNQNNFYVLVTVREEDFRREYISKNDFDFESIELTFDEKEASRIYEKLASINQPTQFLSFKEAWNSFGSRGPLMEFVYLVTQNESLFGRLNSQVIRLQDMVREGKMGKNELELLRIVAVASAYDARLDIKLLCEILNLEVPARTLDSFEKEYFLRQSADKKYVEGLHPIRSSIIAELLTDALFNPWLKVASDCLPIIVEDDLEIFLLYSFSRHTEDASSLFDKLLSLQPKTWTGLAGVFRALLWLGLFQYIQGNRELIQTLIERFGAGWHLFLDFDIANVSGGFSTAWFKELDFIPEENKRIIESIQEKQLPKEAVFMFASQWISKVEQSIIVPGTLSDWAAMSELCFWLGHLNIESPILMVVNEHLADGALETLTLDYVSDLHLALSLIWKTRFDLWLDEKKEKVLNHFKEETNTVFIEDDGETMRTHFIIELENSQETPDDQTVTPDYNDNKYHYEALRRIKLLRKLSPVRQKYGSQGYGHRFEILKLLHDDTMKTGIPANQFPPAWGTKLNSLFLNLSTYTFRPETWREYTDSVHQARNMILDSLRELQNGLTAHYRKQKTINIFKDYIDSENWEKCRLVTSNLPAFPKCIIDEWGFVDEGKIKHGSSASFDRPSNPGLGTKHTSGWMELSLNLRQYHKYLTALKKFTNSLSNFYQQSKDVIVLNAILGKAKSLEEREKILSIADENEIKTNWAGLSAYNLAEALKALPIFQKEFRQLFYLFVDKDALGTLEKRESEIITKSWSLWYQFALHPGRHFHNSEKEALEKIENVLKQIRKEIRRHFSKLNRTGINATVLSKTVTWEDNPTLWITFDIPDPVNFYESFESVMNTLKLAIGIVENNSLKHYALEFWWPTIVVIPLVKGKSLSKTAWKLNTSILAMGTTLGEENWWNYMQHPIPSDSWDKLGLSAWEHPRLDLVNRFHSAVAFFSFFIAHLNDFNRLPELDEKGTNLLQNYVLSLSNKVSETLQLFFDSLSEMLNYFNNLERDEKERRPQLLEAMKMLIDIHHQITNGKEFQGKVEMGLSETKEWIPHLKEALGHAELVRLLWIADILESFH